jgi:2-polyprenyl-6-methoxyphenol hydroxylase-like FAD-dependent oxidoreductase
MLLTNKKIAIIGGGPGGLTLARLLQVKGAEVKVYERDVTRVLRVQGATLDLHYESGQKAIEAAGLLDAFKKTYRPGNDKWRVLDKAANVLYDEHEKASPDVTFGDPTFRPEIDRSDLRDILLSSLSPDTVVWDSHFINMLPVGPQWKIEFKNGTTVVADLVIGADGGNSKIRPFVTSIKPAYTGIIILQGNVDNGKTVAPTIHALLKGGKISVYSDGKHLHVSARGDGSIDFYVSGKMDERWAKESGIDLTDKTQRVAWFRKEFAGWDRIWFELFESFYLPLLVRPQNTIPADQGWQAQPNVTLIGDAAHIMPPTGGGVNLAMLDALELSECLTNGEYPDMQSAIAAYETNMQRRAAEEVEISRDMIAWMHAGGAAETLVAMLTQAP